MTTTSPTTLSHPPSNRLFNKKEDVDYRQLLPQPGMLPSATLPAAFKLADQDDRAPAIDKAAHHPPREPLAPLNKEPAGSPHHPKVEPSRPVTPALTEIERSRRLSFNSPHAASWEKFRQKNPEFKEYQRQASTTGVCLGFLVWLRGLDIIWFTVHGGLNFICASLSEVNLFCCASIKDLIVSPCLVLCMLVYSSSGKGSNFVLPVSLVVL